MNQILQGQPMTAFGDGTQTRAFSYFGAIAPLIAESNEVPAARNLVSNVGADQPFEGIEVAKNLPASWRTS